jgi:predicted DNA-binding transcriptional regulator AlpA
MEQATTKYLPGRRVSNRYGVSDMTLWRWERDAELRFPKSTRINGRRYWLLEELEEWERARAAGAV